MATLNIYWRDINSKHVLMTAFGYKTETLYEDWPFCSAIKKSFFVQTKLHIFTYRFEI